MMQRPRFFFFLLLLVSLLTACAAGCVRTSAHSGGEVNDAGQFPLISVLRRNKDVFASNAAGLYRADGKSKTWKPLRLPLWMPAGGSFATEPANANAIFYYATKWMRRRTPSAFAKISGLYVSHDDGQNWNLVSRDDDYGPVLLLPTGDLFAATNAMTLGGPAHVLQSKDEGASWRDLGHGRGYSSVLNLFPDPDHPGLICMAVCGISTSVYQASDENYDWKETVAWDWYPKHTTEASFFRREGASVPALRATLGNYFAHDFGRSIDIPGFDIVPQTTAYCFSKNRAKNIQITMPFLPEPRTAGAGEAFKIMDQKQGVGVWGLAVRRPDGKLVYVPSWVSQSPHAAWKLLEIERQTHPSDAFRVWEVSHRKSYQRTIDLAKLYDFPLLGVYKVQLIFNDARFENLHQGICDGVFRGQVFTVTIR